MRVQLTVRVEPHTADYVAAQAADLTRRTGIRTSYSEVAAAFLERAEEEGWTIDPGTRPQTSRPGLASPPQPGRDPNTETPRK